MSRLWTTCGAANAFFSVSAGAFAAHFLRDKLSPELGAIFETAARYQMYHALGLIAVGLAFGRGRAASTAGSLLLAGILLFSGSLYALALTGTRQLGAITPFGGLSFLAGWVAFALALARPRQNAPQADQRTL
jgi:uncharacterized membrane protein YgdD (TMEM256/DUF423 family)